MKIAMLALIGALLMTQASATLYLDETFTFWVTIVADPLNSLVRWALYMIYYSLTPILAPVLYTLAANLIDAPQNLTVGSATIPTDEALAIYGVASKDHLFYLLINIAPKIGILFLNGALSTTFPVTLNDVESNICSELLVNLLGLTITCP